MDEDKKTNFSCLFNIFCITSGNIVMSSDKFFDGFTNDSSGSFSARTRNKSHNSGSRIWHCVLLIKVDKLIIKMKIIKDLL